MRGYRHWEIRQKTSGKYSLVPITAYGTFIRGQAASCQVLGLVEHASPCEGCTCGYYVLSDEPSYYPVHLPVFCVEFWGKVVVHEKGWRAEYVEPIALLARRGALFGMTHRGLVCQATECPYCDDHVVEEIHPRTVADGLGLSLIYVDERSG